MLRHKCGATLGATCRHHCCNMSARSNGLPRALLGSLLRSRCSGMHGGFSTAHPPQAARMHARQDLWAAPTQRLEARDTTPSPSVKAILEGSLQLQQQQQHQLASGTCLWRTAADSRHMLCAESSRPPAMPPDHPTAGRRRPSDYDRHAASQGQLIRAVPSPYCTCCCLFIGSKTQPVSVTMPSKPLSCCKMI